MAKHLILTQHNQANKSEPAELGYMLKALQICMFKKYFFY